MSSDKRQRLFLKIGCWVAVLTSVAHTIGQLTGPPPPANETERQLDQLMTTYKFQLPGGGDRSLMEFMTGFSWTFSLFMLMIGALGLVVARKANPDVLGSMSRIFAATAGVMAVICLKFFFIIPTALVVTVAACFVVAAVLSGRS